MYRWRRIWLLGVFASGLTSALAGQPRDPSSLTPEEDAPQSAELESELAQIAQTASGQQVRQFHQVLSDLLAEFAYDIKSGAINKLTPIAVREITVSNAIPGSYKKFVGMSVSEILTREAGVRVVQCVTCGVRNSGVRDGRMILSTPASDLSLMLATAQKLGIAYFVDAVLIYHTTHMILGVEIFSTANQELVWSRTYNSETVRSRYQRLAVDYSQIKKSRESDEYVPEYRMMTGLGVAGLPNIAGEFLDTTFVSVYLRATERFDRRRSEFGLLLGGHVSLASFMQDYPTETPPTTPSGDESSVDTQRDDYVQPPQLSPYGAALSLHALYVRNFLATVEQFDTLRSGIHTGVGLFLASSYLTVTAKAGLDLFFGKTYTLSLTGEYLMPSRILVAGETLAVAGGFGGVGLVSYNF